MWFLGKILCNHNGDIYVEKPVKGFTLVELLVSMVIMVIVAGAAMIMFKNTAESVGRQQEKTKQLQSLRLGFNTIARDVRMAGNGLEIVGTPLIQVYINPKVYEADKSDSQHNVATDEGYWFKYKDASEPGVRAIYGTNSGSDIDKADTLSIFHAGSEVVNFMGRLQKSYTPGTDNSLTFINALVEDTSFSNGDIIALTTGTVAVVLQINATNSNNILNIGERFKPEKIMKTEGGDTVVFPIGTEVFNLKNVTFITYFLDAAKLQLKANYHDMIQLKGNADLTPNIVTVADNIEDFQVNYFLGLGGTTNPVASPDPPASTQLAPNGTDWISAITIGMVSRSANKDGHGKGDPVTILGHQGSDVSGYYRRMMIENIKLRNF